MFGALKRGFRSIASLIVVRNVVGELQPKRTLAASRGFLAAARLSCMVKLSIKLVTTDKFRDSLARDRRQKLVNNSLLIHHDIRTL